MKKDMLSYEEFKNLSKEEQYANFLSYLNDVEKISDLAKVWGVETYIVHNLKSKLKKFEISQGYSPVLSSSNNVSTKGKSANPLLQSMQEVAVTIEDSTEATDNTQQETVKNLSDPAYTGQESTGLTINQEYDSISGNELKDKLFKVINLLEDDTLYQVQIELIEKGKCSSTSNSNAQNRDLIYAIQQLASKIR